MVDFKHHAYLACGPYATLRQQIEGAGVVFQGNPDVWERSYEILSIGDVRDMQERQATRPVASERTVICVSFSFITREAQHALLKVLEEPTEKTHIFLCTDTLATLLPTVLSRVEVLELSADEVQEDFGTFIKQTVAKRSEVTKSILEAKDKAAALALLVEVEKSLARDVKKYHQQLKRVLMLKEQLYQPSSSIKGVLEALVVLV